MLYLTKYRIWLIEVHPHIKQNKTKKKFIQVTDYKHNRIDQKKKLKT